jgi:hypothetical protein
MLLAMSAIRDCATAAGILVGALDRHLEEESQTDEVSAYDQPEEPAPAPRAPQPASPLPLVPAGNDNNGRDGRPASAPLTDRPSITGVAASQSITERGD